MEVCPRPKKSKKTISTILGIIAVILILVLLLTINLSRIRLSIKGYHGNDCKILSTLSNDEIKDYLNYDKIINLSFWNQEPNKHHYYDYELLKKEFKTTKETISYVDQFYETRYNDLQTLNYEINDLRNMMHTYSLFDFDFIIKQKLTWEQISPYVNIKGCIIMDIPEYIKSNLKPLDAVMNISYANIYANKKTGRQYDLKNPENTQILIKNGYHVPVSYVPDDLVEVKIPNAPGNEDNKMRKDAADALEKMYFAAKEEDCVLVINSAYRSAKSQKEIYDSYFKLYDSATAASLVSVPGCSEHQLGLSVDLTSQSVINGKYGVFGLTKEFKWVKKNAHKFGFILRYPSDKIEITGTSNEPWHFRYVGEELATKLYKEHLTLEEYTMKNGFTYDIELRK